MLLARLEHLLLIVFISMLLAAAMNGPVGFLERMRVPRLVSASVLQLLVVGGDRSRRLARRADPRRPGRPASPTRCPAKVQEFQGLQDSYNDLRAGVPAARDRSTSS